MRVATETVICEAKMFYRTSEFDAGFGVQTSKTPEPEGATSQGEAASPWRRTVHGIVEWGARTGRRGQAHRPVRLAPDGLSDHMLRDLGISRIDLGVLGGGNPFGPRSSTIRRR